MQIFVILGDENASSHIHALFCLCLLEIIHVSSIYSECLHKENVRN